MSRPLPERDIWDSSPDRPNLPGYSRHSWSNTHRERATWPLGRPGHRSPNPNLRFLDRGSGRRLPDPQFRTPVRCLGDELADVIREIEGPAGSLEILLEKPSSPARAAVVFAHPLPTQGGTMHTKVVFQGTKA